MKNHVRWLFLLLVAIFLRPNHITGQVSARPLNVRLPIPFKIDGKLDEWKDTLTAYNKTTRIAYTLSNDDQNLYLALRSNDVNIISKIMYGGVSLMLNLEGKRKKGVGPVITYPEAKASNGTSKLDSIGVRKKILESNEVTLERFEGLKETTISIYNEYGIKVALRYVSGNLNYEMLIPFKYLGINAQTAQLAFNIQLNAVPYGAPRMEGPGGIAIAPPPPGIPLGRENSPTWIFQAEMRSPLDFWGVYNIAWK